MNIYDQLNELSSKNTEITNQIYNMNSQLRTYSRALKRAESETSKNSIRQENIEPLKRQIGSLRLKSEGLKMQLFAIESHVLEEELKTRQSGTTTVTKLDNKYRFKFLFSRFRRFGNFTGYLAGRKEEADKTIKNFLIKKSVQEYIRNTGKENLYTELQIDPNSKGAYNQLMHSVIANELVNFDDLDVRLSVFKNQIINKENLTDSADRKEMLKSVLKFVPKKAPDTSYLNEVEALNNEEIEMDEER